VSAGAPLLRNTFDAAEGVAVLETLWFVIAPSVPLLVGLVSSAIALAACLEFRHRICSRATVGLLIGAIGGLATGVVNAALSDWRTWMLLSTGPSDMVRRASVLDKYAGYTNASAFAALAFGLTFTISLLFVARGLPHGVVQPQGKRPDATSAVSSDAAARA
jgi:hypothetical protein